MNSEAAAERRRLKRRNGTVPPDLMTRIRTMIGTAITNKGIKKGDRFGDLVRRHCPEAFEEAEKAGFTLDVDLHTNTHEVLLKGRSSLELLPITKH